MLKKLIFAFAVMLGGIGLMSNVHAENYVVALTSYTTASATSAFAANYPNVTGGCVVDKVTFLTAGNIATPILIGVYDNATSTTAASVAAYYLLTGTNTVGGYNTITVDYPYYDPLSLTNPGFFKADGNTANTVYMSLQYR